MRGRLEVIAGPMFSGKTDELVSRFEAAVERGDEVVALKPARDTRYAADRIVSHTGRAIPAVSIACVAGIDEVAGGSNLIVIDELQFFDPSLRDAVAALRDRGNAVVAAGLDLDFRRTPFETTSLLIDDAAAVTTLAAVCARCGRPAPFTQRLVDGRPAPLDSPRLLVGDSELYEPRCEPCWTAERSISLA